MTYSQPPHTYTQAHGFRLPDGRAGAWGAVSPSGAAAELEFFFGTLYGEYSMDQVEVQVEPEVESPEFGQVEPEPPPGPGSFSPVRVPPQAAGQTPAFSPVKMKRPSQKTGDDTKEEL